jgi:hypothetical protein
MNTNWRTILVVLVSACLVAAERPASVSTWTFEDAAVGKVPDGWSSSKTGVGPGSVWRVVEDATAPNGPHVLAQTSSDGPSALFNLCVLNELRCTDVEVSVSFKATQGKIDQGGGPVWRYQDADNYYIARMNPLEDNFRVYKVMAGKRTQLASADVSAPAGMWHAIRIVHKGEHIQCYLNGKLYLDVQDATFTGEGKIGLWTKADAVTYFDQLRISNLGK